MDPSTELLNDPFLFREMKRATARILQAIERNEKILIYGDYDVDGMTGTALLVETFRLLGYPVDVYIPDRFEEGYGLHLPPPAGTGGRNRAGDYGRLRHDFPRGD
ncbi:MAG: hypothetical protein MPW14_23335 [Candidatus Manganitrophus sp.]|nr:MAG: hypothetical protein MPW14_23335 [Candidatus Manganitrophus sp.]